MVYFVRISYIIISINSRSTLLYKNWYTNFGEQTHSIEQINLNWRFIDQSTLNQIIVPTEICLYWNFIFSSELPYAHFAHQTILYIRDMRIMCARWMFVHQLSNINYYSLPLRWAVSICFWIPLLDYTFPLLLICSNRWMINVAKHTRRQLFRPVEQ